MHRLIFLAVIIFAIVVDMALAGPGELDTTFAGTGKMRFGIKNGDDVARGTVMQPDGKMIVVGSTQNGPGTDYLVIRYNFNGSLDTSFGNGGKVITSISNGGNDVATCVALQPDGKIVVGGSSQGNGTNDDFSVVRYNSDGSLDANFGLGGKQITPLSSWSDGANALAIQPDGKIVLAGWAGTQLGPYDFGLARYTPAGALDLSFDTDGITTRDASMGGADDFATGVGILPDGKIFIVGRGSGVNYFLRYQAGGFADNSWGILGNGILNQRYGQIDATNAMTIQPDGKVLIAGVSDGKFMIVRFNNTGYDTTFNGNGRLFLPMGTGFAEATTIAYTGSVVHKIVVAGYCANGATNDFAVARLDLNGALDMNFNATGRVIMPIGAGDDRVNAVTYSAAGGYAIAGSASNGSNDDIAVGRITVTGLTDTGFDNDGKRTDDVGFREGFAGGLVIQPDGKILVGGYSGTDDNDWDFAVARFNPNGSFDTSFDADGRATADFGGSADDGKAIALQPDGKVIVAGSRYDASAQAWDFAVARFNSDGSPDLSFNGHGRVIVPVGASSDEGAAVAVQADGKIIVGGTVKITATNTDFGVVRLTSTGTLDNSFGTGGKAVFPVGLGNDTVVGMGMQADGKVVIAGRVHNGTNLDFGVARLTTGGIVDNTFGSFGRQVTPIGTLDDYTLGMGVQPDGKVLVGGYKLNNPTSGDMVIVRYTAGGIPDTSFDNDGIVTTSIGLVVAAATSFAVQPDGKILAGGLAVIGQQIDYAVVRLHPNGLMDDSYGINGKAIAEITSDGDDWGWGMVLDSQGRAVIAGSAKGLFGIARLQSDFVPRKTPFDFDGDSKSDVSIFRPSVGEWWVLKSSNGGNFATQFGSGSDRMVPADFTGDGTTDVAFWRPSTGQWFVLRSEDQSFFAFPFGTNGDIPVPADYDGDGKADAAVFRPSNATWFIRRSSDGGTTIQQFGASADQPVPADYDGDGKADVAIRRPDSGQWWINRSTAGVVAMQFGNGSDKTVVGDYTGDGKADVAFWRPSTGQWFVLRSEDQSFFAFPFGANGDIPSPADYDGDGKIDATVFRPAGATWFVNKTSGGVLTVPFGASGDQPVPNAFVK